MIGLIGKAIDNIYVYIWIVMARNVSALEILIQGKQVMPRVMLF